MLKKIFKPKWENSNPAIRKEGVKQLNPANAGHVNILTDLAIHDPATEVRTAAIGKLDKLEVLNKALEDSDAGIVAAAQQRLVSLICHEDSPLSEAQRLDMLEKCSQAMLYEIAQKGENAHVKEQAFILITDQTLLLELATNSQSSKYRQMAVAGIVDENTLRDVSEFLKNKDKKAWQQAKAKLNDLKAENQQQRARNKQQREICENLEQLIRGSYTLQFTGKYTLLRQQWQQLGSDTDAALQARFERASLRCQEIISNYQEEEQQRLDAQEKEQQQRHQQESLCDQLEALVADSGVFTQLAETEFNDIRQQFETLQQQWQTLVTEQRAHPKEQLRFDKTHRALTELFNAADSLVRHRNALEALITKPAEEQLDFEGMLNSRKRLQGKLKSLNWPDGVSAPTLLKDARKHLQELDEKIEALQAQQHQVQQNIDTQLSELEKNLSEGEVHHAHTVSNRIHQNLDKLAAKEKRRFEKRLRLLEKQMHEFDDWRQFATEPKRLELCEEMEKLADIQIPPQQKAQAIKELQEQWKELGDSRRTQKIWQRFKAAADKAYEPCKEFFQIQGQLRNHNYQQREEICQQLDTFLQQTSWDEPGAVDWKLAENLFSVAKQEWSKFTPVDRTKAKALQERFNQLLDQLRDKLRDERKKNSELKQSLIDAAKALLEHEDLQHAIDGAKQLQHQWKDIGITYRKDNQRLWREFRQQCDAVFERRNQERDAEEHEKEENLRTAYEVAERIRELADQNDAELTQSQARFAELKEAYYELGPVPKQHYEASKTRFQSAVDYYQQRFAGIKDRRAEQELADLARLADLCDQLDNLPADADQQRIDQLQAHWQRPVNFNDDWWQKIDQRYEATQGASDEAKRQGTEKRRQLCIRLEILAGLDSPAEDNEARMQLQMDRLSKGLGHEKRENDQQLALSLILDWYTSGPNLADAQNSLQQRFDAARQALKNKRK